MGHPHGFKYGYMTVYRFEGSPGSIEGASIQAVFVSEVVVSISYVCLSKAAP